MATAGRHLGGQLSEESLRFFVSSARVWSAAQMNDALDKFKDKKSMQLNIQLDEAEQKFFVNVDGKQCSAEFRRPDTQVLDLVHVYVPPSLRGQGIAGALVKFALLYAKEHELKVIPTCPYVAHYIRVNPEWNAQL